MGESGRQRWDRAVLLLGVVYLVVGIATTRLANPASSNQVRVTWRLLAWVTSGVVFAAHIWYEQLRLRSSPATTALHASLAVGLGALGLAAAANLHARAIASSHPVSFALLTLVAWPLLTGVPAFVVALGAAATLALRRRVV